MHSLLICWSCHWKMFLFTYLKVCKKKNKLLEDLLHYSSFHVTSQALPLLRRWPSNGLQCCVWNVCFPEFTVQRRTLRSHCGAMGKTVTHKWGDKDFLPSCPSDLLHDHWEILCILLYIHCLIVVLPALNVSSLVARLTFWCLCNNKGLWAPCSGQSLDM